MSSCIGKKFVEEKGLKTQKYAEPVMCYNADRTMNRLGQITEYVEI
jgi:hypothetical protein